MAAVFVEIFEFDANRRYAIYAVRVGRAKHISRRWQTSMIDEETSAVTDVSEGTDAELPSHLHRPD